MYNQEENHQLLAESLDFLEERREKASLRVAAHQQKVARYFNSKVRDRKIQVGVKDPAAGVLGPNWEGPCQIEQVLPPVTYKLARLNGELIRNYWNGEHLRKYYQ